MKRLIYSPSVNVWVRTDTGVFDLSPYVTNFTIDRRVNQVSSASISFRNPKVPDSKGKERFLFTEHPSNSANGQTTYGPMFHPMDPIIITMTRLKGRPVQVFTGYCDTVPYVQLFPGVTTLTASCTLKRLLYTFWDPALPFVRDFMNKTGWQVSPNGTAYNEVPKNTGNLNDSSIGYLLYKVLEDVGGWDPDNIYIQELPGKNIGQLVTNLYKEVEKEEASSIKDFHNFLKDIIGKSAYGSLTSSANASTGLGNSFTGTVTLIGDSISDMSRSQLTNKISNLTIYAEVSKHFSMSGGANNGGDSGLKILRDHKNFLGDVVVIELGTNDIDPSTTTKVFKGWIDQAMSIIGSQRKVVFVNVAASGGEQINAAISNSKSKYTNMIIADWKGNAEVGSDHIHPTSNGSKVLANLISDAIGVITGTSGAGGTQGNPYTKEQLKTLWISNGGNSSKANLAAAVALAESGGHAREVAGPNGDGSFDVGLWQINNKAHPTKFPNGSYNNMKDANKNAKAAIEISSNGSNWQPWAAYNNGSYNQYL